MSKYPAEKPCTCHLRKFPHRRDQFCRELTELLDESGPRDEYADERRLDERERARYVNAINRGWAK